MALHTVTDDGHLAWNCSGCGQHRTAHVSHDEVYYSDESMIMVPDCACGWRTGLKVKFSSEELQSLLDEDGNPTPTHAVAQRHIALIKHMRAAGKSRDSHNEQAEGSNELGRFYDHKKPVE